MAFDWWHFFCVNSINPAFSVKKDPRGFGEMSSEVMSWFETNFLIPVKSPFKTWFHFCHDAFM